MTDDELRTLVAGLATATARNTEAINGLTQRFEQLDTQSFDDSLFDPSTDAKLDLIEQRLDRMDCRRQST